MRQTALIIALASTICSAADLRAVCGTQAKTHTVSIAQGRQAYVVPMGGAIDGEMTRDPVGYWAFDQFWEPNVSVRMENAGEEPVVNPWLRRADRPDTRSVSSIVDFVIRPGMSDAEKARRIWEFEIASRFHATTEDHEVDDVVKRFNGYGYTLCGNESKIISDLWRAAGLKVRRGFPNGHSTAEVYYDGAWHLLDSDESIICLLRDNKTIASEAEIVEDHDLMKRTHTYGPLHDDDRFRDETSSALHYWEGPRQGEQPSLTRHRMDMTLRPGEAITWSWTQGRFHGKEFEGSTHNLWNKRWRLAAHVMNGELAWIPDLTQEKTLRFVKAEGMALRSGPFGRALYPGGKSGSVTVPVSSPYPIVGGRLELDFGLGSQREEEVAVSMSFDNGATWTPMWRSTTGDYARMYLDLDEYFPAAGPARYGYLLKIDAKSSAERPTICLKGLHVKSKLQMARLALPGVSLGDNRFVYSDESPGALNVRITHAWNECPQAAAPGAVRQAAYPRDGAVVEGTGFTFRWDEAPGAADYQFQLSEYADMRWPLSPNFHKLISRTAGRGTASYAIPYLGLINPSQTYYWRVRARSADGVWGPWSKAFTFSAAAPAVPVRVAARLDAPARAASLEWKAGEGGSRPVRFRIYGSAERGFTASARPYQYPAGLEGIRNSPSNLLMETSATSVTLAPELWRAHYRVAAVDAAGHESGPSAMAKLPHPLLAATDLPSAVSGRFYEAAVRVAASIGHLVSANENGKAYQMRFRGGDELRFELSGAPEWLAIDGKSGVLSGFVPPGAAGRHQFTVRLASGDEVKLALEVLPDNSR